MLMMLCGSCRTLVANSDDDVVSGGDACKARGQLMSMMLSLSAWTVSGTGG